MSEKYTIEIIKANDFLDWDTFVAAAASGTIFESMSFLSCYENIDLSTIDILLVKKNKRLIAGFPIVQKQKGMARIITKPGLSYYNSIGLGEFKADDPYHRTIELHRIFETIIPYLEQQFDSISLCLDPMIEDIRPFLWRQWQAQVAYTNWVTLTDDLQIWDNFNKNMKRLIQKAQQKGIVIKPADDCKSIAQLHTLIYRDQGIAEPIPIERLTILLERLLEKDYTLCLGAFDETDQLIAVDIAIWDKKRAYMYLTAGLSDQRDSGASSLLRWELLRQLQRREITIVDLTGVNIPSIAHYKNSMGGKLVPYYIVSKNPSLIGKMYMAGVKLKSILGKPF